MHRNGRILELDDDLHTVSLLARGEVQQRMLVKTQLREHAFQAGIGSLKHNTILADRSAKSRESAENNVSVQDRAGGNSASCGGQESLLLVPQRLDWV